MAPVDMVKISKKYLGLWVAFDQYSKPIASGQTIEEVIKESKKKGFPKPILTKLPTENFSYIL